MKQIKIINPEGVTEEEAKGYKHRRASRAVVFDEQGLVGILHASRDNYYKLPGGGIEGDEDVMEALKRECLEEIGCNIEVIKEIGSTTEYRRQIELKQESYCYIAKVVGEKGEPNFTKKETEGGFKIVWTTIDEAIKLIKENYRDGYNSDFVILRDSAFLEEAKLII